ncbi:hypothetical protein F5884DRAFT_862570 [Xylogone sp. PMI_703]|nr:hypothetical protein F5884DRAFT_862570 [Xylogone sp. PMI_703]
MFSGLHGMDVAMDEYASVLMVASGFGIAALQPYLKKLIHGYNTRVGQARRIHVVWQISNRANGLPVQEMLNHALEEDKMDNGYPLVIGVCGDSELTGDAVRQACKNLSGSCSAEIVLYELSRYTMQPMVRGKKASEREEAEIRELTGVVETGRTIVADIKLLVAVSGPAAMRDELRKTVGKYLQVGVKFVELDY